MSKFKVGDSVRVTKANEEEEDYIGKTGTVLEILADFCGFGNQALYELDIESDLFSNNHYRVYENEIERYCVDTTEYTLENWSTRDLLEELLRRDKNALDNPEETRG